MFTVAYSGKMREWNYRRQKLKLVISLFSVPPPLGTLAPPDEETIESSSFLVELTQASNEMGVIG